MWHQADVEFQYKRLFEECPAWAVCVPPLFASLVVAMIVYFRAEGKLTAAIVGSIVVGSISLVYLPMALILRPFWSWMVILVPVMTVALYYVGMMYINDAKSVHWLWAIFLGVLRTSVYVILSVVFLLPGCQYSETQKYEAKTLILFDVSNSMHVIDDLPEPGQDPAKLPSRQDKILKFLLSKADEQGRDKESFIEKVLPRTWPIRRHVR
jgi:hypothetical protein